MSLPRVLMLIDVIGPLGIWRGLKAICAGLGQPSGGTAEQALQRIQANTCHLAKSKAAFEVEMVVNHGAKVQRED